MNARAPRRRARRAAGFTLLELLAVVALLGVILFFVVPKLDNVSPRARLKAAARKIGSTMELAQGQAIATGKEYVLAYDVSKGTFWIILPPPDDPNARKTPDPNEPAPPPPDVEHDPKPAVTTPTKKAGETAPTTAAPVSPTAYQGRETAFEDTVGDDVGLTSVSFPNNQEVSSGVTYVKFSSLGNDGSHAVLLRLKSAQQSFNQADDSTMAVRFNALTRTTDFANQKLTWGAPNGN